jgi:hypothetical protein
MHELLPAASNQKEFPAAPLMQKLIFVWGFSLVVTEQHNLFGFPFTVLIY